MLSGVTKLLELQINTVILNYYSGARQDKEVRKSASSLNHMFYSALSVNHFNTEAVLFASLL